MYVMVHHQVSDPQKFWSIAQAEMGKLPQGLRLLASIPNMEGTRVTCLWEGTLIDAVKGYLESKVGTVSKNEYLQADPSKVFGIPRDRDKSVHAIRSALHMYPGFLKPSAMSERHLTWSGYPLVWPANGIYPSTSSTKVQ